MDGSKSVTLVFETRSIEQAAKLVEVLDLEQKPNLAKMTTGDTLTITYKLDIFLDDLGYVNARVAPILRFLAENPGVLQPRSTSGDEVLGYIRTAFNGTLEFLQDLDHLHRMFHGAYQSAAKPAAPKNGLRVLQGGTDDHDP